MRSLLGFLSSLALVLGAPAALAAESTGIGDAPAAGPAESTPAPAPAPAKTAPAKAAPAKAAPAKAAPAKTAPAKAAPAKAAPAKAPAAEIRTDAEPAPPPPPAAPVAGVPSADNEPEETFPDPKAGVVSASTLNIRTSPSIDKSQIVTALKRGRQLTVVGRKGKWLKIELPSDIALWVMTKYVTLPQNAPLPAAGVINADSVRVRTGGDQKAPILKQVELDTQVEVLEKVGEWVKIKAPAGTYGWAFGNYVKTDGTEVAVAPTGGGDPVEKPPVTPEPGEKPPTTVETSEPGTPTAPEVVKGPGVEAFAEAETAYRQAQAEKEPDLVPVFLMYHKAAGTPGVPAAVKNKCDQRMAEIAKGMPDAQKKKVEAEVKRGIEAQLAAIRAAAEAAKAQVPRVAPVFTAVGFVDRAPDVPGVPGTHKLSLSGVLLFYLRPAADGLDLDRFESHKVGVVGRRRFVKGWSIEVIDVVDLRDYQDVPGTSSRLEVEP